jgi:hypothetical protein
MASDVLICNAALQMIKHSKTITSLEQGTKEANSCEVIYTEMRDSLLSMHNWNFAIKRVQMSQIADTDDRAPVFEWAYGYEFPGDFLRLVSVFSNSGGFGTVPYRIEANQVNTDATTLFLRYVHRVTDPNLMIPLFRLALSKLLASRLAVSLSQSASRSTELYKQLIDEDLPTAKSADSIQDYPDEMPESSWVSVRSSGGGDNELRLSTD